MALLPANRQAKLDSMSTDQMNVVVELSAAESWALLRRAVVGRLALTVDGRPEIFPVNHMVDHGTVVFRTAVGTKLGGPSGTGLPSRWTGTTVRRSVRGVSW